MQLDDSDLMFHTCCCHQNKSQALTFIIISNADVLVFALFSHQWGITPILGTCRTWRKWWTSSYTKKTVLSATQRQVQTLSVLFLSSHTHTHTHSHTRMQNKHITCHGEGALGSELPVQSCLNNKLSSCCSTTVRQKNLNKTWRH